MEIRSRTPSSRLHRGQQETATRSSLVRAGAVVGAAVAGVAAHDLMQRRARDPAQLPGRRAPAATCSSVRPRAAPVHRHRQRRGAAVQPRPAPLDLRVGEAQRTLLRLRHRQRVEHVSGDLDHQAPRRSRSRAPADGAPASCARLRDPRREGARRARAGGRHAFRPRVGRQHLGDELRRRCRAAAVEALNRGRRARRLPAEHRRGRRSRRTTATAATWSSRSARGYFGCRDAARPLRRSAPAQDTVAGAPVRAIEIKLSPGRQAGPRRHAAGGEGDAGDRRDPRHRGGARLRQPAGTQRVPRRRRAARLRRADRRRDRPAGRASSRPSASMAFWDELARAMARDRGRGVDFVTDRRRRGRHRRRAARLHRPRRAAVQARLRARLRARSREPGSPRTSSSSAPASSGFPDDGAVSRSRSAPTWSTSAARR